MSDYERYGRGYERHWPHFDRRGPEFYYDEPGRPAPYRENYFEEREFRPGYYDDPDIYEDEFYPREEHGYRPYEENSERWPDDEFAYDRGRYVNGNFIKRGLDRLNDFWRDVRGEPQYQGNFPEDRYQKYYGTEAYSENANRGRPRRNHQHHF